MQKNIYTKVLAVVVIAAFAIPAYFAHPSVAKAETCNFTTNLEVGSVGEDVRCLQKYLNSNGFVIAASGVGSPGFETNMFGGLTREAVKKWQMSVGISPATGTFGPFSKEKYLAAIAALLTSQVSNYTPSAPTPSPTPTVTITNTESAVQKSARNTLEDIEDLYEDAEELIDDLDDDNNNDDAEEARETFDDLQEDLRDAFFAYIGGDYDKALSKAKHVKSDLENIIDDLEGNSDDEDEQDAEDAIEDAQDAIDEAEDAIDEAQDDGDDTDDAEDLLDEAKDKLDDAEEAFDDEDFDDAIDLAEEAEDLANDAIDEL